MPELPEVTAVAKILNKKLKGLTITDSMVFYSKLLRNVKVEEFKKIVKNQKILEVTNIAKHIIIKLEDYVLISHLRMEGKWSIELPDVYSFSEKHLEIQLMLNDGKIARYYDTRKFGTLDVYKYEDYLNASPLAKMGPIPMETKATPEYLYSKTSKSRKAIKTLLLDQNVIAGLGNIYVNEVLFDCKIYPEQMSNTLSLKECDNILKSSRKILTKAIELGGTTIHSFKSSAESEGNYQDYLKVHMRENENCSICGTQIKKMVVNGRGTYYCPSCQRQK